MLTTRLTRLFGILLLLGGWSAACSAERGAGGKGPSLTPPAAPAYSAELQKRLREALAAKDKDYEPRTHHLHEDGSPEFINRLMLEASPYLLQHAHNPVNWYAWGDAAFEEARRLGRPVLLSIGYSTCHWCHVMERESFEDKEIAAYLNANYIAIKVDREERPDLDAIYMSAVQSLTGRGGWPMTTWLTPEGEPFFGGTYFPARDGDRGSRKGFLTLLREMKDLYDSRPDQIAAQAKQIVERVQRSMAPARAGLAPETVSVTAAAESFKASFDSDHGGRRQRPKFPSNLPIRLLLRAARRTGDTELLQMAELTLTKMAAGGMYDQIGGGFHRYSTDEKWLVPHFEKMLYDNGLLTLAYLEGYQATGRKDFAAVARDILEYVAREMTAPGGAFYSATDADSLNPHGHMEEGWFFTWTPAEIDTLLAAEDSRRFQSYYGVTPRGNFEGRTILNVTRSKDDVARMLGLAVEDLEAALERGRETLYAARAKRPPPLRDDKVLTSWNGLMISAMARGGFVLDEPEFVERAARAAEFLLEHARRDGRLLRSFMDGRARHNGYLDDYAFFIAGLVDLYQASGDERWLREAIALQSTLDGHYQDSKNGGYFMTSDDHEPLLAREKPLYDGAEPSGNSVALMNLVRLHELTSDDRYRAAAEKHLRAFGGSLRRSPAALSEMLLGLDFWLDTPKEVVLVTAGNRNEADPFLDVLRRRFLPNKIVVVVPQKVAKGSTHAELVPLIRAKVARSGQATAYVCERGVCQLPTTDVDVFSRQLESSSPEEGTKGRVE